MKTRATSRIPVDSTADNAGVPLEGVLQEPDEEAVAFQRLKVVTKAIEREEKKAAAAKFDAEKLTPTSVKRSAATSVPANSVSEKRTSSRRATPAAKKLAANQASSAAVPASPDVLNQVKATRPVLEIELDAVAPLPSSRKKTVPLKKPPSAAARAASAKKAAIATAKKAAAAARAAARKAESLASPVPPVPVRAASAFRSATLAGSNEGSPPQTSARTRQPHASIPPAAASSVPVLIPVPSAHTRRVMPRMVRKPPQSGAVSKSPVLAAGSAVPHTDTVDERAPVDVDGDAEDVSMDDFPLEDADEEPAPPVDDLSEYDPNEQHVPLQELSDIESNNDDEGEQSEEDLVNTDDELGDVGKTDRRRAAGRVVKQPEEPPLTVKRQEKVDRWHQLKPVHTSTTAVTNSAIKKPKKITQAAPVPVVVADQSDDEMAFQEGQDNDVNVEAPDEHLDGFPGEQNKQVINPVLSDKAMARTLEVSLAPPPELIMEDYASQDDGPHDEPMQAPAPVRRKRQPEIGSDAETTDLPKPKKRKKSDPSQVKVEANSLGDKKSKKNKKTKAVAKDLLDEYIAHEALQHEDVRLEFYADGTAAGVSEQKAPALKKVMRVAMKDHLHVKILLSGRSLFSSQQEGAQIGLEAAKAAAKALREDIVLKRLENDETFGSRVGFRVHERRYSKRDMINVVAHNVTVSVLSLDISPSTVAGEEPTPEQVNQVAKIISDRVQEAKRDNAFLCRGATSDDANKFWRVPASNQAHPFTSILIYLVLAQLFFEQDCKLPIDRKEYPVVCVGDEGPVPVLTIELIAFIAAAIRFNLDVYQHGVKPKKRKMFDEASLKIYYEDYVAMLADKKEALPMYLRLAYIGAVSNCKRAAVPVAATTQPVDVALTSSWIKQAQAEMAMAAAVAGA